MGGWTPHSRRRCESCQGSGLITNSTSRAQLQPPLESSPLPLSSPGPRVMGPSILPTSYPSSSSPASCPSRAGAHLCECLAPGPPPASLLVLCLIALPKIHFSRPSAYQIKGTLLHPLQSQPCKVLTVLLLPHQVHSAVRPVSTGSNPHPTGTSLPPFLSIPASAQPGQDLTSSSCEHPSCH